MAYGFLIGVSRPFLPARKMKGRGVSGEFDDSVGSSHERTKLVPRQRSSAVLIEAASGVLLHSLFARLRSYAISCRGSG